MIIQPLTTDERAGHPGATHIGIITHADLTETAATTAQTKNLAVLAASMAQRMVEMVLVTPFQDEADAAHNSTLCKAGDAADDDRFMTSTELNVNGSYVKQSLGPATDTIPTAYTAADNFAVIFTPPTGKNLNALTKGEVWFYLQIRDARGGGAQ